MPYPSANCHSESRLAKLIARLGSGADGERLAVLGLLDRELGRAGVTWTDLAQQLLTEAPGPTNSRAPVFEVSCEAAQWVWRHPQWRPTGKERDFVATMAAWQGPLSDRQAAWLAAIVTRLGGQVQA